MGRSSRLYRGLVSTGLARSAGSGTNLHIDPHLWTFSATALPGVEPERIEAAIEQEIDRLKTSLASEEEFVKARKQIRAQYVYSRETVTAEAFWQGQMEIIDHAGRMDTLSDELNAVTPEDVQRVVREWLVPDQRTVGWQVPDESTVSGGGRCGPDRGSRGIHLTRSAVGVGTGRRQPGWLRAHRACRTASSCWRSRGPETWPWRRRSVSLLGSRLLARQ